MAIQRFRERSKVPQAPHVERDMNHANVQEHAGEQSPPLAAKRKRPQLAPQCTSCWVVGLVMEIPASAIPRKTAALIPTRACVTSV